MNNIDGKDSDDLEVQYTIIIAYKAFHKVVINYLI